MSEYDEVVETGDILVREAIAALMEEVLEKIDEAISLSDELEDDKLAFKLDEIRSQAESLT